MIGRRDQRSLQDAHVHTNTHTSPQETVATASSNNGAARMRSSLPMLAHGVGAHGQVLERGLLMIVAVQMDTLMQVHVCMFSFTLMDEDNR